MRNKTTTYELMLWLVLVVTTIVVLSGVVSYVVFVSQLEKELVRQSQDVSNRINDAIALSLWNLDTERVIAAAREQKSIENIANVKVFTDFGEQIADIGALSEKESYLVTQTETFYEEVDVGSIELTLSRENITSTQYAIIRFMAVIVILMITAISLTTYFLMRRLVSRPVQTLVDGLKEISGGNYDHKIQPFTQTDMNFISDSFNHMTAELRFAQAKFQELNKNLEEKVSERTKELAEKNTTLEKMNDVMVKRELRMIELKEKIASLEKGSENKNNE